MSCYSSLAAWYDQFTLDVPYEAFADLYEAEFARCGGEFRLLLDLCCGTGTLTREMTRRGYELIAVDASVDMLMQAQSKAAALERPPLFLCQDAAALDLYGTVDAAYCSLDGMNYIAPELLPLHWAVGVVTACFVLDNLLFALGAFVLYYNLLNLGQNWVGTGRYSVGGFMLALHGGALALGLLWLTKRHFNWSWRSIP